MGYRGCMGYEVFPANQFGGLKNVWNLREYGVCEPWVTRESTVYVAYASARVMISGKQKRSRVREISRRGGKGARIERVREGRWNENVRCSEEEWEREWIGQSISRVYQQRHATHSGT